MKSFWKRTPSLLLWALLSFWTVNAWGQTVPPALLKDSPATYPPELVELQQSADITLELLVDASGAVTDIQVLTPSPHPRLEAEARRAAALLVFTPATVDGVATPAKIQFSYQFQPPPPPAAAPSGVLTGEIRARGTRRPLPGAVVLEKETKLGETQADGHFKIALAPGEHVLSIHSPGYKPETFREKIGDGQQLEVVYSLEPLRVDPYETVVRGEKPRREISRITLHDQEIREVPGTMGDPFRVVMLMPGVSSIASGIAYPVVRGTQPAATGYFIDGIRVPALFHAMLGPAVIHPQFLETVDFYPGSPPVRYGRLLGGAIEGSISKPHDDRVHVQASADLINAAGFVELPIEKTGTHVTLAGRFSYTAWLIALLVQPPTNNGYRQTPIADMYDYQARIEQKAGNGKLRLFVFGSSDVFGVRNDDPTGLSTRFVSIFHRGDIRYRRPWAGGEVELGFTAGAEKVGVIGDRGQARLGDYLLQQATFEARARYERDWTSTFKTYAGIELEHRRSESTISAQTGPTGDVLGTFRSPLTLGTFLGAHAQAEWLPHPAWTFISGIRFDNFHLVPDVWKASADPRLAVRYAAAPKVTLKAGASLLHQAPTVLLNLPVMDISGLRYGLQEALQTDVGVEWKALDGLEVTADVYYNPIFRSVEFDLVRVLQDRRRSGVTSDNVASSGRAYGFELMVRHPLGGNWFGWLSYSYQRSFRRELFARFDNQFNVIARVEGEVPFAFEQKHVLNAAISYKFANGFTLGTVVHFNTGRPESGDVSSRTMRASTDAQGRPTWAYVDRDRVDRLPPFFRVDVRLSKSWLFDNFMLDAYLDVLNATFSKEVLAYDYYQDTNGQLTKRPTEIPLIIPLIGVKGTY